MAAGFTDYPTSTSTFDEAVGHDGTVRAAYEQVAQQFDELGLDDVRTRAEYVSKRYHDQGVTFDYQGEERPFPLDIVPRIIEGSTWSHVEEGVGQRVRARPHPPASRTQRWWSSPRARSTPPTSSTACWPG